MGFLVGLSVGSATGSATGLTTGAFVGSWVGSWVGSSTGEAVGLFVGRSVGLFVGFLVVVKLFQKRAAYEFSLGEMFSAHNVLDVLWKLVFVVAVVVLARWGFGKR